jgi:hypothetical protein
MRGGDWPAGGEPFGYLTQEKHRQSAALVKNEREFAEQLKRDWEEYKQRRKR